MSKPHKAKAGVKLSEHFSEIEFACHGNGMVMVDLMLITKLEKLRKVVGKPITITSGYRSPEYNKKIGGATKSQHILGKAADIKVQGLTPSEVAKFAEKVGFGGIGIYDSWIHVDVREGHARWDERNGKGE